MIAPEGNTEGGSCSHPHAFTHSAIVGVSVTLPAGNSCILLPTSGAAFGTFTYSLASSVEVLGEMAEEFVLCLADEKALVERAELYKWPADRDVITTWSHAIAGMAGMLMQAEVAGSARLLHKACESAQIDDESATGDMNALLRLVSDRFKVLVLCAVALRDSRK